MRNSSDVLGAKEYGTRTLGEKSPSRPYDAMTIFY